MGIELCFVAVILLALFAVFDLIVGVSNDAVNFLNASIGSRVAPRFFILIIASLGILAGVTFSSGMMEVARKGIFHPHFFILSELITIFLAVMLTDIILLDLFNTFGLPTSTTVSIVFELLGAAVVVSLLKIVQTEENLLALGSYINTGKAMTIILGILGSVAVAFVCGAFVQFLSRLIFSFDYAASLRRYGAVWGGIALATITYFILVKGAKGSAIMTAETVTWIKEHTWPILGITSAVSAVLLQVLLFLRINILKLIILIGTFALAMAFAANDLVNFIGVPMAGYHAYETAAAAADPMTTTMEALGGKVQSETALLLLAGAIMVLALWLSKKARTVSATELSLGRQVEGEENYESMPLSRTIVRMIGSCFGVIRNVTPLSVRTAVARRLDSTEYRAETTEERRPPFDLLRAAVNLTVASAVISYATSWKLPLSTTYVTFMVSMGSSFADQAWGRESAVYRVTGVLTVIGGWFMTAFLAFTISGLFALAIYFTGSCGVAVLLALVAFILWKTHHKHRARAKASEQDEVFNLKKVKDASGTVATTFEHMSALVREIRESLDATLEALFAQNVYRLGLQRGSAKRVQRWTNIITANIFKALRLLQKGEGGVSHQYAQTTRRLQKLADGHRDIVMRAYMHVANSHKGLLDVQVEELEGVRKGLSDILQDVETIFTHRRIENCSGVIEKDRQLRQLSERLHQSQVERIRDESSKTRLNILYYAIIGNALALSKQCVRLLQVFERTFEGNAAKPAADFDLD
jgi:hypothetical protein